MVFLSPKPLVGSQQILAVQQGCATLKKNLDSSSRAVYEAKETDLETHRLFQSMKDNLGFLETSESLIVARVISAHDHVVTALKNFYALYESRVLSISDPGEPKEVSEDKAEESGEEPEPLWISLGLSRREVSTNLESFYSRLCALSGSVLRREELHDFGLQIDRGPEAIVGIINREVSRATPQSSLVFTVKYFSDMKLVSSTLEANLFKTLGFELRACLGAGEIPDDVLKKLLLVLVLKDPKVWQEHTKENTSMLKNALDAYLQGDMEGLSEGGKLLLEAALVKVVEHDLYTGALGGGSFKKDFQAEVLDRFQRLEIELKIEVVIKKFINLLKEGYCPDVDGDLCSLFLAVWECSHFSKALDLLQHLEWGVEYKFIKDICSHSPEAKALIDEQLERNAQNRPSAEEEAELEAFRLRVAAREQKLQSELAGKKISHIVIAATSEK